MDDIVGDSDDDDRLIEAQNPYPCDNETSMQTDGRSTILNILNENQRTSVGDCDHTGMATTNQILCSSEALSVCVNSPTDKKKNVDQISCGCENNILTTDSTSNDTLKLSETPASVQSQEPYQEKGEIKQDISITVQPALEHQHEQADQEQPQFKIGDVVHVESRTWPGINKLGGVGKVMAIVQELIDGHVDFLYNVKYVLGGFEKRIEEEFVHDLTYDGTARTIKPREFYHGTVVESSISKTNNIGYNR